MVDTAMPTAKDIRSVIAQSSRGLMKNRLNTLPTKEDIKEKDISKETKDTVSSAKIGTQNPQQNSSSQLEGNKNNADKSNNIVNNASSNKTVEKITPKEHKPSIKKAVGGMDVDVSGLLDNQKNDINQVEQQEEKGAYKIGENIGTPIEKETKEDFKNKNQGKLFSNSEGVEDRTDDRVEGMSRLLNYAIQCNLGGYESNYNLNTLKQDSDFNAMLGDVDDATMNNLMKDMKDLVNKGNITSGDFMTLVNNYPELGIRYSIDDLPAESKADVLWSAMSGETTGGFDVVNATQLLDNMYNNVTLGIPTMIGEGMKNVGDFLESSKHEYVSKEEAEQIYKDMYKSEQEDIDKEKERLKERYKNFYIEGRIYTDKAVQDKRWEETEALYDEYFNGFGNLRKGKSLEEYQSKFREIDNKYSRYASEKTGTMQRDNKDMMDEYNYKMELLNQKQEELDNKIEQGAISYLESTGNKGLKGTAHWLGNTLLDAGSTALNIGGDILENPASFLGGLVKLTTGGVEDLFDAYAYLGDVAGEAIGNISEGNRDVKTRDLSVNDGDGVNNLIKFMSGGEYNTLQEYRDDVAIIANSDDATVGDKILSTWLNTMVNSPETTEAIYQYLDYQYGLSKENIGKIIWEQEEGERQEALQDMKYKGARALHENFAQVISDFVDIISLNGKVLKDANVLSKGKYDKLIRKLDIIDSAALGVKLGKGIAGKILKLEGNVITLPVKAASKAYNKAVSNLANTGKLSSGEKSVLTSDTSRTKKVLNSDISLDTFIKSIENGIKNLSDEGLKIKLDSILFDGGVLREKLANNMSNIETVLKDLEGINNGLAEDIRDTIIKQTLNTMSDGITNSFGTSLLNNKSFGVIGSLLYGNFTPLLAQVGASLGKKFITRPGEVLRVLEKQVKLEGGSEGVKKSIEKVQKGEKLSKYEAKELDKYIKDNTPALRRVSARLKSKGLILSDDSSDINKYNASIKAATSKMGAGEGKIKLSENAGYTNRQKEIMRRAGYDVDINATLGEGETGKTDYSNKKVSLTEESGNRTAAHEAFHALFSAVDAETQGYILNEAKKILRKKLGIDVTDDMASEWLAESYGESERRKSIQLGLLQGETGLKAKVQDLFQKTYEYMQNKIGDRDKINQLFDMMSNGEIKNGVDLSNVLGTKRSGLRKWIDALGDPIDNKKIGSQGGASFKKATINPNAKDIGDLTYRDGNTLKIKSYISEASKQFNETAPKKLQGVVGTHMSDNAKSEFGIPEGHMYYSISQGVKDIYKTRKLAGMKDYVKQALDFYKEEFGIEPKIVDGKYVFPEESGLGTMTKEDIISAETYNVEPQNYQYDVLFGNMENTKIIKGGGRLRNNAGGYSDAGVDVKGIKTEFDKYKKTIKTGLGDAEVYDMTNEQALKILKDKGGEGFIKSLYGLYYDISDTKDLVMGGEGEKYSPIKSIKNGKGSKVSSSDIYDILRYIDDVDNGKKLSTYDIASITEGLGYDSLYFDDIIDATPGKIKEMFYEDLNPDLEQLRGGVVVTFKNNQAKSLMNANPTKEGGFSYKRKGLTKKSGKTTKKGISNRGAKYVYKKQDE